MSWVWPVHVAFTMVLGHVEAVMPVNGGTLNTQSTKFLPDIENGVHVLYAVLAGMAGGGGGGEPIAGCAVSLPSHPMTESGL
jgi:hypothetical protein